MNNGRLAFFNLVKEMRAAQKEYFRTRAHSALVRSKDLERRGATAISNINSSRPSSRTTDNIGDELVQYDDGTWQIIGK